MSGDGFDLSRYEQSGRGGADALVQTTRGKSCAAFRLGTARQRDLETRAVKNVAGRHADGRARPALAVVRVPPGDGNFSRRGGAWIERINFARNDGARGLDLEFDEPDGVAADARHRRGLHAVQIGRAS